MQPAPAREVVSGFSVRVCACMCGEWRHGMSAKCMLRPANSKRMLVFIVKFFCPEKAGDSQDNFHILSNLSTHLGGNSGV